MFTTSESQLIDSVKGEEKCLKKSEEKRNGTKDEDKLDCQDWGEAIKTGKILLNKRVKVLDIVGTKPGELMGRVCFRGTSS